MSTELTPLANLANYTRGLANHLEYGCGNHGCVINPPKGQGTNCSCRCEPKRLIENFLWVAEELEKYGRSFRK